MMLHWRFARERAQRQRPFSEFVVEFYFIPGLELTGLVCVKKEKEKSLLLVLNLLKRASRNFKLKHLNKLPPEVKGKCVPYLLIYFSS